MLLLTYFIVRQIMEMLLHSADISNPCKPMEVSRKWTDRVVAEFYKQVIMAKESALLTCVMLFFSYVQFLYFYLERDQFVASSAVSLSVCLSVSLSPQGDLEREKGFEPKSFMDRNQNLARMQVRQLVCVRACVLGKI